MERKIEDLGKDIKEAFGMSTGYVYQDSSDIRERIAHKLPEVNCRRIMAVIPVFWILCAFYMAEVMLFHHRETMGKVMALCTALLVIAVVYEVLLVRCLYIRQMRHRERMRRCMILYRSFWWIWLIGLLLLCFLNFRARMSGAIYIFACIVACLVPLYPLVDFVVMLISSLTISILAASASQGNIQMLFYDYIVMLVIGFIAQRLEIRIWAMREYIYLTAFRDPLTGLLNRRGGNALLEEELGSKDGGETVGVLMMDIDYFKKYNDSLGHDAGDACLKMVSGCIRETVKRRTELMIRHGGEEFVVLFLDATEQELRTWGERIRQAVIREGLAAPYPKVADVVTVSIGAAMAVWKSGEGYEPLLEHADAALYDAKNAGRNRVVFR